VFGEAKGIEHEKRTVSSAFLVFEGRKGQGGKARHMKHDHMGVFHVPGRGGMVPNTKSAPKWHSFCVGREEEAERTSRHRKHTHMGMFHVSGWGRMVLRGGGQGQGRRILLAHKTHLDECVLCARGVGDVAEHKKCAKTAHFSW